MPDIFDDPDVKAAMAAARVVRKPGLAQEVLRDLAPFLAEEGIDMNDLGDTDLDTINRALARATTRYNQSLPSRGSAESPVGGSPFIRPSPTVQLTHSGAGDSIVTPIRPGSASGRHPKRGKHVSGHPGRRDTAQFDRSLTTAFDDWLHRQPTIAAPSPGEESSMLAELLRVARHHRTDLRTPGGVLALVDLFGAEDDPAQDDAIGAALDTLHDYVHFRMDTATDPADWDEAHDAVEDALAEPFPGADILNSAMNEADQIDPDVRRAAYARTRVIAAVSELLAWLGSGRKVAPSGGLRRVDIAFGAGLLGIEAVGVDRVPPLAPDSPPLIDVDDPQAQPGVIRVRSMQEVPLLPSWWGALASAGVIEVGTYRVTPGPAARDWTAESSPPLDQAEMIIGLTVAQYVCKDLASRAIFFADRAAAIMVSRLIRALAPGEFENSTTADQWDELLDRRAVRDLQRLERVGVVASATGGEYVVPAALRGAVAGGVAAAIAILSGDFETD